MKLSDYVIDFLVKQNVSHIFEMIGGGIAHLLDSIYERTDIESISVRHEQAAAFAAEGYSRVNGNLGVAMATSGPGALNLVTGIGSCYFDSVPCLFITGQVNTYEYKFDNPIRQIGFQETDIVSVVKPITKYAKLIANPNDIRYELEKSVYLAKNNRSGPVLLDIPMNIQRAEIEIENLPSFYDSEEFRLSNRQELLDLEQMKSILELMSLAERPIILVGGGVRTAGAIKELEKFIDITQFPVVSSLMGIDSVSHNEEKYFGLIGSYGNRYSNLALANSDLIIILGSRLDSRQTGTRVDTFGREAKKIHVDIDPLELNAKVKVDISICKDLKTFLSEIIDVIENKWDGKNLVKWYEIINNYRDTYPTIKEHKELIEPNWFMNEITKYSRNETITLDVGQHQMWASQSILLKKGQRLLNSGGMGAMGFALPAAIGASLANNNDRVITVVGDGGFQVNLQELDTIVNNNIPIIIIVINNNSLGMVRQFQDLYFEKRRQSTIINNPDFEAIAKAYRMKTFNISNKLEIKDVLEQAFKLFEPILIHVGISIDAIVNPKLVVNRPIEDMSPHLAREELESLMLIDLAKEIEVPK